MRSISRLLVPVCVLGLLATAGSAKADASRAIQRDGKPWIHMGDRYLGAAPVTDIQTRALAVAKTHAANATLIATSVDRFGDGEAIVHYEQSHLGLPVIGRGAAVRMSPAGQPLTTVVDVEEQLPSDVRPSLTAMSAASIASTRMPVGASASDAHLIVWPTIDRGARLAYAVVPRMPAGIPMAPRVIVDAMTGEVLEARNMLAFANKAFTYDQNPIKTPTEQNADLLLAPTGTTLTNPFIEATNCIDKKTVKPVNMFGFNLTVHICDLVQVATANASGDWVYEPSDVAGSMDARKDAYSEVSIYYHTAKAYAFFRGLQGEPDAQVVVDKPLKLVANLQIPAGLTSGNIQAAANPDTPLDTFQNAFFSPAEGGLGQLFSQLYGFNSGALWFGQGPQRDYAYDGDVVYHEFTHAVVDKTLKLAAWHVDARGAVDSPGAMNEGLADYFSSAISGDPDVGEYAAKDLGGDTVIRSLANNDKCPTGIIGEVHADSTVFSGALWEARTKVAEGDRGKFDAALYKAMRTNAGSSDLGYEDLGKLFLATLKTDLPDGATKLEAAMTGRGLLPVCERIVSFEGAPIASHDKRIGFAAPGLQSVNVGGMAPGILQVQAKLPPKTASVTVSFSVHASGGGGAANPLGGQGKPFTPVVLAKLGKAITWTPKSKAGHDAELKVNAKEASGATSAQIDLPTDQTADSIYVQIASTGDQDGAYDSVTLSFTPGEGAPGDGTEAPPTAPAAEPVTTSTESCGCKAVGSESRSTTYALLPGIAAAAALLARRRRVR